jgi:hypothetical protein
LARFLYALPVSTLGYRTGRSAAVPDQVTATYAKGLQALLELPLEAEERTLKVTPDAYEEWHAFFKAAEPGHRPGGLYEHVSDWVGKLPGAAARIAGILHCAKYAIHDPRAAKVDPSAAKVDLATMAEALDFAGVLTEHARAVFALMGANLALKEARKLWSWIERERNPQFTFRDAHRALHGSFPLAADLEPAFAVLLERAYLRAQAAKPQGSLGRPSRSYEVNPTLSEQWR